MTVVWRKLAFGLFVLVLIRNVAAATPEIRGKCPSQYDGFVHGKSTVDDVRACLGPPDFSQSSVDGQVVYIYEPSKTTSIGFLFDVHGVLVKGVKSLDLPKKHTTDAERAPAMPIPDIDYIAPASK